jgi:hypothetical protein
LVADGKPPNGSTRPHPSQRRRRRKKLPIKLLDDPKIPTVRRNPRKPHHFHKHLDIVVEMGLKPERPYFTRRRHHHLIAAPVNLDPKGPHTSKKSLLRDCALRRFVPSSKKTRLYPRPADRHAHCTGSKIFATGE